MSHHFKMEDVASLDIDLSPVFDTPANGKTAHEAASSTPLRSGRRRPKQIPGRNEVSPSANSRHKQNTLGKFHKSENTTQKLSPSFPPKKT